MTFQMWGFVFTGMVASILLLNIIQWITYRTRIYGLYTLYMLAWLLRVQTFPDWLSPNAFHFVRTTASMMAFYVYFDFADAALELRRRLPALYRLFPYAKGIILVYIAIQVILCFVLPDWHPRLYEAAFGVVRALLAIGGFYAVVQLVKLKDTLSRYFLAGTLFVQVGSLVSQGLSLVRPMDDLSGPLWTISLAYLQLGVILELICFSLGLSYEQRQIAVRHAMMEQELDREREQRHREHLEAELSVQRLEQEKAEAHIRALQGQVNPHFLFNSLNVLDSLIEDDPEQAHVFLDELSSVYRYLLRANEQPLTELADELAFIQSYYQLLRTRHGNGVQLFLRVDEHYLNYQLPPLTLQLLVENAVKHNVVLPDQPLQIDIATDAEARLLVRNNIQRKTSRVASNGVGLSNILAKYQMLGQKKPVIWEADGQFLVTLPLIEQSV
ncbi:histidine kinase [Spirosoma taeanense]|uniref:Histidine kinase n=1 Tax=Spirosoma taeanense TaxID=2735870 RepID=A0A6M5YA90_9BACT|nr:histidine kinase [Spirosoma taeanense]QJW90895.1 histidine kinase [Spirosoma taeanense]